MQAWIMLYFNMLELIHGSILNFDINHARIKLKHIYKGWFLLPMSSIKGKGTRLATTLQFPSNSKQYWDEINSSILSLSIDKVKENNWANMLCDQV